MVECLPCSACALRVGTWHAETIAEFHPLCSAKMFGIQGSERNSTQNGRDTTPPNPKPGYILSLGLKGPYCRVFESLKARRLVLRAEKASQAESARVPLRAAFARSLSMVKAAPSCRSIDVRRCLMDEHALTIFGILTVDHIPRHRVPQHAPTHSSQCSNRPPPAG